MKSIHRTAAAVAVLALLGLSSGCMRKTDAPVPATQAAPAPAEAAPLTLDAKEEAEAEPTTLADAEALLEKARRDLDRLALNAPASRGAGGAMPPSVSVAPAPAPGGPWRDEARSDKSASASGAAAQSPPEKEANTCETACKAFSSLTRASDAVCRLDTDGGKRCERARQIREDASHRVASCGCAK